MTQHQIEHAYALINTALAAANRRQYRRDRSRDEILAQIIEEQGLGYVQRIAGALSDASLHRLKVQTSRLIENPAVRARLLAGAYARRNPS